MAEENLEDFRKEIESLTAQLVELQQRSEAASRGLVDLTAAGTALAEFEEQEKEHLQKRHAIQTAAFNGIARSAQGLINAVESTEKSFKKYNAAIDSAADGISSVASQLGGFGKALGFAGQALAMVYKEVNALRDAQIQLRDATFKSGAGMGATAEELKKLARESGFTYHNMERVNSTMKGLSGSFKAFQTGTDSAGESFLKLTHTTEKQRAEFSRLGFSYEELMEAQAGYVKAIAAGGRQFHALNVQTGMQASLSKSYVKDLALLAEMTGTSVEEQQKKMEAQMTLETERLRQAAVQTEIADMNKRADALLKSDKESDRREGERLKREAADKSAAEDIRNAEIARATAGMSEEMKAGYITLMNTGGQAIDENSAQAQMMLQRAGKNATDLSIELQKKAEEGAAQVAKAGSKEERDRLLAQEKEAAMIRGGETAQAVKEGAMQGIRELGPLVMQAMGIQGLKAAGIDVGGENRFQTDEGEITKQTIENQRRTTEEGTSAIADAEVSRQEFEKKSREKMEDYVEKIGKNTLALHIATGAVVALTGYLALRKMGGLFGGAAKTAGSVAGAAGGGAGGRVLSTVGGLDSAGAGSGAGLKGLFTSLGSPAMIAKAGWAGLAIATFVTAISAGVAASIYLISKSLPTLAKSLRSFEDLDGDKLWSVGKGILGLGAGLAVFGVGGAAAGIGNMLGEAASGITKLFGGKSMLDKIKEFSDLDIKVEDFERKAEALQVYAKAMAMLGGAGASVGIGGLFGGKKVDFSGPIKGMEQLSAAKVNTENVAKFAPALATYIEAINKMKPPKTGLIDGLLAAFGKEKKLVLPLDSFKEFVENISGVTAEPEKIKSFTGALAVYLDGLAKLEGIKGSNAGKIATGNIDAKGFVKFLNDLGSAGSEIDAEQFKSTMEIFKTFTSALSGMKGIESLEDFDFENVAEEMILGLDELDVSLDKEAIEASLELTKKFSTQLKEFSGAGDLQKLEDFDYEEVAEEMIDALKELSRMDGIDDKAIDKNLPLIKDFFNKLKELEGIGLPSKDLVDWPYEDFVNNVFNGIVDVGDPDGPNPDPEAFYEHIPLMYQFLTHLKGLESITLPSKDLVDWPYEDFVNNVFNGIVDVGDPDGRNPKVDDFYKHLPLMKKFMDAMSNLKNTTLPPAIIANWPFGGIAKKLMNGVQQVAKPSISGERFEKNIKYMDKLFKFWSGVEWQQLMRTVVALRNFKIPENVYREFDRLDKIANRQRVMQLIDKAAEYLGINTGGGGGGGGGGGSRGPTRRGRGGGSSSVSIQPQQDTGSQDNYTEKLITPGMAAKKSMSMDDEEGKINSGGGGSARSGAMGSADAGDAAKGPRKKTQGLIIHHIGGRGIQGAIRTLQKRGLGYHYLIDQDGAITSYVPDDQVTWHAGDTDKNRAVHNGNTVSISLGSRDDNDVSQAQLQSGFALGKQLMDKYGIASSMVFGHGQVTSRKMPSEGETLAGALRTGEIPKPKVSADAGGVASGPESGYPAVLHGKEQIVPLGDNSILEKLGQMPSDSIQSASSSGKESSEEMIHALSTRLDEVIRKLEESNDIQDKILKYSMT